MVRLSVVIFEGGKPRHELERQMFGVREAVVLDTCEKLISHRRISRVIVCSDRERLLGSADRIGAYVVNTQAGFNFARTLIDVVRQFEIDSLLYMGGSAAPLLREEDVEWMADQLETGDVVIANNALSADFIAVSPTSVLSGIDLPVTDNFLGYLIWEAGFKRILTEERPWLGFDLDTPTDYLILETQKGVGKRTAEALRGLDWPRDAVRESKEILSRPRPELFLAGRVGTDIVDFLNGHLKSRVRVLSEERGMKALGRDLKGEVCSLLAEFVDSMGPERFFDLVSRCCDAAFIDTRAAFSHWTRGEPSVNDRYNSDLFRWETIDNVKIREFTKAASGARVPVLLGGHTVVGGGLWSLASMVPRAQFLKPGSSGMI